MTAEFPRLVFFCLSTGAAMGCLFLLFRALRVLLDAGKLLTAVFDLLGCLLCGLAVFLCALAVDAGRLRLLQLLLQLLGGWAAYVALRPFVDRLAGFLRGKIGKVSALFRRFWGFLKGHFAKWEQRTVKNRKKRVKKPKKAQKKT